MFNPLKNFLIFLLQMGIDFFILKIIFSIKNLESFPFSLETHL